MTDIRYFTSPASAVKKDPNDYRNDPDYRNQVESIIKAGRKPNLAWCSIFTITEAEASMYEDPEWAFENLIVRGPVVVIPAPPNGGKTTILMYIAKQIAPDYQVFYVNADISSGDVKRMRRFAAEAGFTLLLPDMKAGKSMADVVDQLIEMNRVDADYSRIVFIFDTLKKMTDVINKKLSKELYTHPAWLIGQGYDLIYFIPKKNEDGSLTVSSNPDKVRAHFRPITFTISPELDVSQEGEFVDVARLQKIQEQREKDETVIEAITEAIQNEKFIQIDISNYCRENHKISRRSTEVVLKRYKESPIKLWKCEKGFQNNALLYYLIDDRSTPPV